MALLERGLLAPAERVLMEDLIAFTEEHFARLLPFTTLQRHPGEPLALASGAPVRRARG